MADEAPVIVTPKPLAQSWTARINMIVGVIGVALIAAPDFIAQLMTLLTGEETKALLAFMPEKYRHVLEVVVRALGVAAAFIGALNIWIRKYKTIAPITGAATENLPEPVASSVAYPTGRTK